MTKATYLFCTKLRMFISEIPLAILLTLSIIYNGEAEGLLKLWPMIIALSAFMIFIVVYFFRAISISYEEIRAIGFFSSRESRTVEKDKTVIITLRSKHRLRVELLGKDSKPAFDWIKEDEGFSEDINLFNEKAVGGKKSVQRVLSFFGVPKEELDEILSSSDFEKEYENVKVSTDILNEEKRFKIKILETV